MALRNYLNEDLVLVKRSPATTEDDMGDEALTEVSRTTFKGRIYQPRQVLAREYEVGRDLAVSHWICDADMDLDPEPDHQDWIERTRPSGVLQRFEVNGTPYPVQTPRGDHHWMIAMELLQEASA
jgi:hypothetical protein